LIGIPSRFTECPATSMAHPGYEFLRLERLDYVVVGARLKPQHDVDGVALGGQHDDGHAGLGAYLAADVYAVHARQHQIEQHQVGTSIPERLHGVIAIGHERRVESFSPEHDADHFGEGGVVVDDQHTTFHGPHRSTETPLRAP
jgi:hypothetical protein